MLTLIKQKKKKSDLKKIESFLGLLKDYQDVDISTTRAKKATFIIAESEKHEVYGGAVLYPLKVDVSAVPESRDFYEETLFRAFRVFQPAIQEFWMARVCLCIKDKPLPIPESIGFLRHSYKEMYKELITFGEQKNLEFLAFTLNSASPFMNLLLEEEWPGRIDITYSADTDRLCHGVLPIKETKFLTRKPRKTTPDLSPVNQTPSKVISCGRIS